MKIFIESFTPYHVGTSAEDNWELIRRSDKESYWVHADGEPSAHVVIALDIVPLQTELNHAAFLVKQQTKMNGTKKRFVACPVGNLRFGSKPGEVIFKSQLPLIYFSF
jgi:predicted ribosome quality control (RQC) complex YloA/Tae2 family protein